MSEEQFRDVLESALRGVHDDTDVAIIWADETITRLQVELVTVRELVGEERKRKLEAYSDAERLHRTLESRNRNIESLTEANAELQQRVQELERLLTERDGGVHDPCCKIYRHYDPVCTCGHDEVMNLLQQPKG